MGRRTGSVVSGRTFSLTSEHKWVLSTPHPHTDAPQHLRGGIKADLITPNGGWHMPPIPDGGHWPKPQSSGKGYVLGSAKTGSGGQWKEAGRGGRKGKTHVSFHLCPPSTHSSLPCPTFCAFRWGRRKETATQERDVRLYLKSSERKEKSQNHRRRKGF